MKKRSLSTSSVMRMGGGWEVNDEDWDRLREQLCDHLMGLARQEDLITYGDLVQAVPGFKGPDSYAFHHMLGEISRCWHAKGMPLLSALAISKDTNMPGNGFFELAKDLGVSPGGLSREARYFFWVREVQRCYDAWGRRAQTVARGRCGGKLCPVARDAE